jgi:uncharacterized protein
MSAPGEGTPPRTDDAEQPAGLLERYLRLTREALALVRPGVPARSFLREGSEDVLSMARAYLADAEHFSRSGDRERALAAVSYAHGWLDAGVRLGLLDGREDAARFTLFR